MRFIFVFGVNNKEKVIGQGEFYCPHCQTRRQYERKVVRSHISLYFVPLIPIGKSSELIECTVCHRAFPPEVLKHTPEKFKRAPQTLAELINSIEQRLHEGEPADYLIRNLTANGLEFPVAADLVGRYLKLDYHFCERCGLSYTHDIETCAECGGSLITRNAKNN